MSDTEKPPSNLDKEEATNFEHANSNPNDKAEYLQEDLSDASKSEDKNSEKLIEEFDNKLTMTPNTNQFQNNTNNNNNKENVANLSNLNQTETPSTDSSLNSTNNTPTVNNQTTTNLTVTPNKIEILLKAVGNAPILKNKKFLLERTKNVHYIIGWLKKYMKLEPKDQLFLYVNQEFAPSPDAEIGTIYDCFKIGNTVIFHYCITPAWG